VCGKQGLRRTVATYPHFLHAINVLSASMSCRPIMALTSGALKTCMCALGTCEPSYTGRLVRLFFMFKVRSTQGTAGRVTAHSPPYREGGSRATGNVVHQSPPSRSGVTTHMMAPEPFLSERWDPELLDTWQLQSPPSRYGATVHVTAPEPFLSGRWDPEPLDTWQLQSPPWLGGRV
jgi:hypothetical protein